MILEAIILKICRLLIIHRKNILLGVKIRKGKEMPSNKLVKDSIIPSKQNIER